MSLNTKTIILAIDCAYFPLKSRRCGTVFDVHGKEDRIKELETQSAESGFWDNPQRASGALRELESLRQEVKAFRALAQDVDDVVGLFELDPSGVDPELARLVDDIEKRTQEQEVVALFRDPYDALGAILSFRSGAGGVDAQDWTEMLMRMIMRWCERVGMRAKVFEKSSGTEAGIKSALVEIEGKYAYGKLRGESGVHRLVRLSPFNSDNLRQTSFAQIEVLPKIVNDSTVEIDLGDLRIDTYRASGAGGQHVNKTDSAVRITHEPTGVAVSCQSERSQLQNKERAMALLRSRLMARKIEEQEQERRKLRGEPVRNEWGSQIRSYVLHPYKMVKDHRVGYETSHVDSVLDGDISPFIDAYLRYKHSSTNRSNV